MRHRVTCQPRGLAYGGPAREHLHVDELSRQGHSLGTNSREETGSTASAHCSLVPELHTFETRQGRVFPCSLLVNLANWKQRRITAEVKVGGGGPARTRGEKACCQEQGPV